MKFTKKQLKNIILKEFVKSGIGTSNFDVDNILYPSDGDVPPPSEQERSGRGRSCEPGGARYERIYTKVMNVYQPWVMSTFPQDQHEYGQYGEYANYLSSLNVIVEEYGRNLIRGFIVIMESIIEYLCNFGGNMYKLFNDPRPAL